jgi:hypothetical protein
LTDLSRACFSMAKRSKMLNVHAFREALPGAPCCLQFGATLKARRASYP